VFIFKINFLDFVFISASVLKTFNGTEHDVNSSIASCLKYAPDRRGGGGRGKEEQYK